VNKAASVSVYAGEAPFRGSGKKEDEIVGTIAEPRIQRRTSDLLDPYTTAVRSKNISEVVTVGAILTAEQVNILPRTRARRTSENPSSTHSDEKG
jgi:hypothetical protein